MAALPFEGITVTSASDSGADATIAGNLQTDATDGDGFSLREALHHAPTGETIRFAEDISEIQLLAGQLSLDRSMTIEGDGRVTVNMQENSRFLTIDSDAVPNALVTLRWTAHHQWLRQFERCR